MLCLSTIRNVPFKNIYPKRILIVAARFTLLIITLHTSGVIAGVKYGDRIQIFMKNLENGPALMKSHSRMREIAHLPAARGKIAIFSRRGDHFGKP